MSDEHWRRETIRGGCPPGCWNVGCGISRCSSNDVVDQGQVRPFGGGEFLPVSYGQGKYPWKTRHRQCCTSPPSRYPGHSRASWRHRARIADMGTVRSLWLLEIFIVFRSAESYSVYGAMHTRTSPKYTAGVSDASHVHRRLNDRD